MTHVAIPEAYFLVLDHGRLGRETVINWEACSKSHALDAISEAAGDNTPIISVQHLVPSEGTCRDVTEDMARELLERLDQDFECVPSHLRNFIDAQLGAGAADAHDATLSRAA